MPIQSKDLQFVQSQVMDDTPEGGGRATDKLLFDGASNQVVPDISEADRAGGRVRLRKVFFRVNTADTDQLLGANVIVGKPPADPNVTVSLFSTGDFFDRRGAAQSRLEAYLYSAGEWPGYLFENHLAGQRACQLFQRVGAKVPEPGSTLVLVQSEGVAGEKIQYIRVTRTTVENRTFTYESGNGTFGDYEAAVVTCELSDALRYDFSGSPASRAFSRAATGTKVRDVIVADAAKYYGASKLSIPAAMGAMGAKVDSIFTRLVPSAQTEIPMVDRSLVTIQQPLVKASPGAVTRNAAMTISNNGRLVFPSGIAPGSMVAAVGALQLKDDGKGSVINGAGQVVGDINYQTGEVQFGAVVGAAAGNGTMTWQPAAPAASPTFTTYRDVTLASRAYVWVIPLSPLPAPGTLELSYMAQGKWVTLTDNGRGGLGGGEDSAGSGTVSYVTGTLNVTLGALPDVGSKILVAWATPSELLQLTEANLAIQAPKVEFALPEAAAPGTMTITWMAGGVMRTATDDGHGGLTGDASGTVFYATGAGWLRPAVLPDAGAVFQIAYNASSAAVWGGVAETGASFTGQLPLAPVRPGSVSISLLLAKAVVQMVDGFQLVTSGNEEGRIHDDGAGNLILTGFGQLPGASIDYQTGNLVLSVNVQATQPVRAYPKTSVEGTFQAWVNTGIAYSIAAGGVSVHYQQANSDATPALVSVDSPAFRIDLTPRIKGSVIPGSVVFSLGGKTFSDRNGKLYHSIDSATGAGIVAGAINYETGMADLSSWPAAAPDFTLLSGLVNPGSSGRSSISGRTVTSPLKSQSFALSAVTLSGVQVSAQAGADGTVTGDFVAGKIDVETGIYALRFGRNVQNPENPNGQPVWEPAYIDASSLRYNAVAYSYLPLDAALLGLDPVRLPSDGRVPIFRRGDYVVVSKEVAIGPAGVSAGQVVNLGAERLSRVRVVGANGLGITAGWSADLDSGTVTFNDVAGYSQPVRVVGRVEDMVRLSDVQINGQLSFTRALTHDYTAGCHVSSAMMLGDMKARVANLFDQQTWDNSWSDVIKGSAAVGTFDDGGHPITVTNAGAITERWIVRFTNTTEVEVIGEHIGVIAKASIGNDIAPNNPDAGVPYFTIPAAGFGAGWAVGNIVRFNTVAAGAPVWVVMTVQQGAATVERDAWELLGRGDVDRP